MAGQPAFLGCHAAALYQREAYLYQRRGRPAGESYLNAYDLETGDLAGQQPTEGMLSQPMAALQDVLIYQDGHKYIAGMNANSLELLWKKEFKRILYRAFSWRRGRSCGGAG